MSVTLTPMRITGSVSLFLVSFLLVCCGDRTSAMLYIEPAGVEVPVGNTVTVGAQVTNPPEKAHYVWRAKRGQLNPQESADIHTTKYTAPSDYGEDVITLEIKNDGRVIWTGDKVIEVIAGDSRSANSPLSSAAIGEAPPGLSQTEQRLIVATFSERGQWGAFFTPGAGYVREKVVKDPDPVRGDVLDIEYDVSKPGDFSGVWIKFQSPNFQPNKWSAVSFWVKGDAKIGFTQKLKVELKLREANWGWRTIYIANIASDRWQQFRLRLNDFERIDSWDSSDEFILTFENREVTAPKGKIYLDHIAFEK